MRLSTNNSLNHLNTLGQYFCGNVPLCEECAVYIVPIHELQYGYEAFYEGSIIGKRSAQKTDSFLVVCFLFAGLIEFGFHGRIAIGEALDGHILQFLIRRIEVVA